MVHMMNAGDIPKGLLAVDIHTNDKGMEVEFDDYTWWISVYDLSRRCVYYRGYTDLSVKRVCLDGIPDERATLPVDANFEDGFKDLTADLEVMSEA
jgi:hypothetical protein